MANNLLDVNGFTYFWGKLKALFNGNLNKDAIKATVYHVGKVIFLADTENPNTSANYQPSTGTAWVWQRRADTFGLQLLASGLPTSNSWNNAEPFVGQVGATSLTTQQVPPHVHPMAHTHPMPHNHASVNGTFSDNIVPRAGSVSDFTAQGCATGSAVRAIARNPYASFTVSELDLNSAVTGGTNTANTGAVSTANTGNPTDTSNLTHTHPLNVTDSLPRVLFAVWRRVS